VITFVNLGATADFLARWMHGFAIAWPSAALAAFVAMPLARRATAAIVRLIGE
jgi:hypothetical protein